MKLKIFISQCVLLFTLLLFSTVALAEEASTITIVNKKITIKQAIDEIEKQSGYSVAYNQTKLNVNKVISLNLKKASLNRAMKDILANTEFTYKILGKQIVISVDEQKNAKRSFVIQGQITDETEGLPLVDVYLYAPDAKKGTSTDANGNYVLSLPGGKSTIQISYVGYETKNIIVDENTGSVLNIKMVTNNRLNEAVVVARKKDENITRTVMGVEKMDIIEVRKIPALLGEVDIIKALQLLPGVQAASEGGSGFSVRGGSPDQNLILLDNTTVYNASHMLGFFSVFNNDVISSLELYKGDLPLKHGGRLASLLDVQTLESRPERFSATGGIGLISSRLMMRGTAGNKTSWLVSGRRSYADLFLKLSSDKALNESTIYFYDLNAKLTHRFSDKDRVEFNGYYGKDKFGTSFSHFDYGNAAGSLAWLHTFNDKLYSRVSLNVSNYSYGLGNTLEGATMNWKSGITDYTLRADFGHNINESFKLSYGYNGTFHSFSPSVVSGSEFFKYESPKSYALEHGLYLSNEQKVSDKISLRYGLRWSVFQNIGEALVYNYDKNYEVSDSTEYATGKIFNTYHTLEPRLGIVYKLNKESSIKANYAHNAQFIQLANNSASGSPLDVWFTASPNVKPQQADLFSLGYFRNFKNNTFETSVEAYYKDLSNVIDFAEHAQLLLNRHLEGEIRTGKGKAYGIEFMIRKNTGRLTGFINYTLSRSERTIKEINKGKTYVAPYDKPHMVNIMLNYELSKKWSISASWIGASGNPTTYPTGRFEVEGEYLPIYSGRNEYRRPMYHRLDLSVTFVPKPDSKKRWKGEWNFSLYNAYGKKNPWMINFKQDGDSGRPYAEMTYLFGMVPSITYNFKF